MNKNTEHMRWRIVNRRIFCVLLFAIMLFAALGTSTFEGSMGIEARLLERNFKRLTDRLERIEERLEDMCTCLVAPLPCDVPLHTED